MVASSPQTDDSVDLREYAAVLSRRKWVILLFTIVFTGLALAYSSTATPVYTGFTEILLLPQISAASGLRPDQLVSLETEARVVTSAEVAEPVMDGLGVESTIPAFLKRVTVKTTPETLVLDILFTAGGPDQAAAGANAFAEEYLKYKSERGREALVSQREVIKTQIDGLEEDRDALQDELRSLDPDSAEYDQVQENIRDKQTIIDGLRFEWLSIPTVPEPAGTIILPATPPLNPSSPNHKLNLAAGLLLGLFIGVIVAFVRDRIDDKVGDRADLEALTTVLATIPRAALVGGDRSVLVTESQPRSPAAEAYRSLRTSIMAMRRQSGDSVFAIASPVLGDGKSTTTANLAAALSHADKRVLVISADLRRPSLHEFFGKANDVGLAQVLLGEVRFSNAIQTVSPSLVLLSSGTPPARPAEILQSQAMRELIRRERERYDFIFIDCPPVLGIADTVTVAPFVDAVILVARAEKTKRSLFIESMDSLEQVGAVLGGAVINDIAATRGTYSYGYGPETDRRRFRRKGKGKAKGKQSKRKHREQLATAQAAADSTKQSRPVEEPAVQAVDPDDADQWRRPATGSDSPDRPGS